MITGHRSTIPEPTLAPETVERILAKFGLPRMPALDLAGLNAIYAAFCASVPFDNVQKRIWFAGSQNAPLTGGDPTQFFENWLRHGTGGTCWPINGALCTLLDTLGFNARRIAGSIVIEGYPQGANHGSVLVTLEGVDYLVDGWITAFKALPLIPGKSTSAVMGIHDVRAVPIEGGGFEVLHYAGWSRDGRVPFRPEPEHDPVDHFFFLARYERTKGIGFFNDALIICRHFPDFIITIGRYNKVRISSDGSVTKAPLTDAMRRATLIEEFGLSEEIVNAIPPDVRGAAAPPGL